MPVKTKIPIVEDQITMAVIMLAGAHAMLEACRKQFLLLDPQCLRQKADFSICYATNLRLDFGNGVLADVPADARATRRQHGLRPALAVTDFSHDRTDNVLRSRFFAHDFALTICERGLVFLPISEGTDFRQARSGCLPPRLQCTMGTLSML